MGGGRFSNCSMTEAIGLCEEITGSEMDVTLEPTARIGDHRWWISDVAAFERDYPDWRLTFGVRDILEAIHAEHAETWVPSGAA